MAQTAPATNDVSPSASAFAYRDFRFFFFSRVVTFLATQIQSVAIGWQVYEATHRPLDLGYVGLAQFLPAFGLSLTAGQLADRLDRRRLLAMCGTAQLLVAAMLVAYSMKPIAHIAPIYALLFLLGTARALAAPAAQAIVPELVAPGAFSHAVTVSSVGREGAVVIGPALGGALFTWGRGAVSAHAVATLLIGAALVFVLLMKPQEERRVRRDASPRAILAGLRYVWREKILLGVMTLDLFAVLLGGAVALLPVYARDILAVGPSGLGALRSAPAIGAACMGLWLARRPLQRRAGRSMFVSVAVFGLATIVFGVSRHFVLSIVALLLMGASDMISVVVRSTVVQIATPRSLRGRVSAVNMLSITASNQLGEFESGLTAELFGTVPAVVLGGAGTCLVVLLWARWFPSLRGVDRLEEVTAAPDPDEQPAAT